MEAMYPGVTVSQVGSYFVGQYYQILQQNPHASHQFYTESSKVLFIDGDVTESASSMLQIHALLTNLNFTGIEIKTIHSLDSWNDGLLVMVSGIVQTIKYNARRKFVQTFFLAPQDKGYYVLNDMFHFLDEEEIYQHPAAVLANGNYEIDLVASNTVPVPEKDLDLEVPQYTLEEEIQTGEYVAPVDTEENYTVNKYSIPELQQQISESDDGLHETHAEEPTALFPNVMDMPQDPLLAPLEEQHVDEYPNKIYAEPTRQTHVEPAKHTYASILRLAKGQSSNIVSQNVSSSKTVSVASDWNQAPQSAPQQYYPPLSSGPPKSSSEVVADISMLQDEGEEKSVYVGNLPSSVTASDLEHEFMNFGRIKPDGVAVRSRKETGGYYAFVEFEEVIAVQNALKASPILLNGRQIYVEERKPNSSLSRGGRGRGRGGRGVAGYQPEAPRGRFGGEREFSGRARANGHQQQRVPRQERGILGPRNSQNSYEAL